MEFGIFAQLFVPRFERDADPQAEHKRIMRNVDCSLAAERAGLKYIWGPAHPAMWVAAGSPPTFTEAGELGLGAFCFSEGAPRDIEPLVRNYKNAIANATPVGDYVNDNLMAVTNLVCMEDRNEAFKAAS